MTGDLGALGFWLMVGLFLVASAIKEGYKERVKQETLRALVENDGQSATKVLAYIRESDAAGATGRDKKQERQAILLTLLEKDSTSVTEVLAYMRERDAAEAAEAARARARVAVVYRRLSVLALGVLAIAAGIFVFSAVRFGLLRGSGSLLIPLLAMFGIWAAGLTIAWRKWPSGTQTNDAHADA